MLRSHKEIMGERYSGSVTSVKSGVAVLQREWSCPRGAKGDIRLRLRDMRVRRHKVQIWEGREDSLVISPLIHYVFCGRK